MHRLCLGAFAWVALGSACDRPSNPPTATPAPTNPTTTVPSPHTSMPPLAILRLSPSNPVPRDLLDPFSPSPGLPTLNLKVEYGGPKSRLEIDSAGWHQGKKLGANQGRQLIHLPFTGDAAFGFAEGRNPEGKAVVSVIHSISVGSNPHTGTVSGRTRSAQQYGVPPINDRRCRTYEPQWPLEIPDGKEAVFWGVFVDEPPDAGEPGSPEERARRADTAWLFRIRVADERK